MIIGDTDDIDRFLVIIGVHGTAGGLDDVCNNGGCTDTNHVCDVHLQMPNCSKYTSHECLYQVSHILQQAGEEGLRSFNSWTLTEEEEADPAIILQKSTEQLEPAENFPVSRLRIMGYRQRKDESLDDFL